MFYLFPYLTHTNSMRLSYQSRRASYIISIQTYNTIHIHRGDNRVDVCRLYVYVLTRGCHIACKCCNVNQLLPQTWIDCTRFSLVPSEKTFRQWKIRNKSVFNFNLIKNIQVFVTKVELNQRNEKMVAARMLHFVLKIGDRGANINFFRNILGMKVSSFFN